MEENRMSFNKASMYYGAIIGTVLVIFLFISYALKITTSAVIGYLQYAVILIGVFLAQKRYRDMALNGYISYGKAYGFGLLTSFWGALILGFFSYVLYALIDPSLIDQAIVLAEETLWQQGRSDEEIELAMAMTSKMMSPLFMSFSVVIGITFIGALFALGTSIAVKKNDDSFEGNFPGEGV